MASLQPLLLLSAVHYTNRSFGLRPICGSEPDRDTSELETPGPRKKTSRLRAVGVGQEAFEVND